MLFLPVLSNLESAKENIMAIREPAKADMVTPVALDKKRIPAAAPALAPEETPMMSGEARGLRNMVW